MRWLWLLLGGCGYAALLALFAHFDPSGLSQGVRLGLLAALLAFLVGTGGFLHSFAPNDLPTSDAPTSTGGHP